MRNSKRALRSCLIFGALLSRTPARLWAQDTPPAGVIVERVAPRSGGARAGLRTDDEIVAWARVAPAADAGARSVLATLWSVSDQSTSRRMKRFYRYLKAGRSRDEALRLAQMISFAPAHRTVRAVPIRRTRSAGPRFS